MHSETEGHRGKKIHMLRSLRFKIALAFGVMLFAGLAVINYYPVQIVRQQMIVAAEQDMKQNGTIVLATGLASLSTELRTEDIESAVAFFEPALGRRVLVVDANGIVIYDSAKATGILGRVVLIPEIISALEGYDSFSCTYTEEAFQNRAASPIIKDGAVAGAVFFDRDDEDSAMLLAEVRADMFKTTAVGVGLFFIFSLFFNTYLSRRFDRLLLGISAVGMGDYDYQIQMGGNDELHDIAGRFNDLSRKLKYTESVRRQFVSDASHELKTPLASMKLLSDSIEQNANVSERDMREFVHDIGEEIQRMIRISESLLSLTRLDSVPQSRASMEKCDVAASVKRCAELLRGSFEFYGVTFELNGEGRFLAAATGDGLFHIIFNLMENAIKYNRHGGHVWVRLESNGDYVILRVRDDGIGIPKDESDKIFDRFYRVDKTRSRDTGGTGLGLSIVKEWVDSLGGSVAVESRIGEGTAFTVALPAWKEGEE